MTSLGQAPVNPPNAKKTKEGWKMEWKCVIVVGVRKPGEKDQWCQME